MKNYCIACKKRGDDITFLRRIIKGGADDSYGIEVAALAGLPHAVIKRAKEILAGLDTGKRNELLPEKQEKSDDAQLSLFDLRGEEISGMLREMDLSTYTPIEALNKLYELQKLAKG